MPTLTFADSCDRRLLVSISEMTRRDYKNLGVFRFRMDVTSAENIDSEIFLYRRFPIDPESGEETDEFCSICSPVDMEEYPIGEPDVMRDFPFFRKNFVDLMFRATSLAEEAQLVILQQIEVLLDALCRADQLVVAQEVWIPNAPEESASGDGDSASS